MGIGSRYSFVNVDAKSGSEKRPEKSEDNEKNDIGVIVIRFGKKEQGSKQSTRQFVVKGEFAI